jgi:uncharacterized protein YutE (UPF0331/DUF86 family)
LLDRNVILRKLSELDTYLGQIREYAKTTLREYKANWKTQRIVERTLQMMIETCVDVASHIVSDRNFRAPTGYADTFIVLAENAVNFMTRAFLHCRSCYRPVFRHQK